MQSRTGYHNSKTSEISSVTEIFIIKSRGRANENLKKYEYARNHLSVHLPFIGQPCNAVSGMMLIEKCSVVNVHRPNKGQFLYGQYLIGIDISCLIIHD